LPNHRTIALPDANHFFFEDAADQVIAEIRAFVSCGPNARSSAPKQDL
jgi:haloalkane dehalogenase